MTLEKQSDFARRVGVDKSQVTRWKQDGRVVMVDGMVDVEASLARLEATRGTRHDVSDRHAAERGQPLALDLPAPPAAPLADTDSQGTDAALDLDEIGRRTRVAQMLKEEHAAALKRIELSEREGQLIAKGDVVGAVTDAVAVILSAAEAVPDRLAPILIGADVERARALLRDEMETLLATVSQQLGQLAGGAHP